MPKYLIEASYSAEGVRGVAEKGGTARREAVGQLVGSIGGTMGDFFLSSLPHARRVTIASQARRLYGGRSERSIARSRSTSCRNTSARASSESASEAAPAILLSDARATRRTPSE